MKKILLTSLLATSIISSCSKKEQSLIDQRPYFENYSERQEIIDAHYKRGTTISFADVDNDGDKDLIIDYSSQKGDKLFFENMIN